MRKRTSQSGTIVNAESPHPQTGDKKFGKDQHSYTHTVALMWTMSQQDLKLPDAKLLGCVNKTREKSYQNNCFEHKSVVFKTRVVGAKRIAVLLFKG